MKRRPCIWSSSKSPSPSKSAARRGIGCAARSPQAPAETRSTPVDGAAHRGLRGAGSRPGAWRPWCRFSSTALLLEVAQPCRRPAAQERMRGRGAVCLHVLEPAIVREPPHHRRRTCCVTSIAADLKEERRRLGRGASQGLVATGVRGLLRQQQDLRRRSSSVTWRRIKADGHRRLSSSRRSRTVRHPIPGSGGFLPRRRPLLNPVWNVGGGEEREREREMERERCETGDRKSVV